MAPTWIDRLIDFFVIFSADILAAYVVLTVFEARKEDAQQAKRSLEDLLLKTESFIKKYSILHGKFKSDDSNLTNLSKDICDEDRLFDELANNGVFWSFKGAVQIRPIYENTRNMKDSLSARTVGEAKKKLSDLVEQLNALKNECESQLKPKRICFFKK